MLQLIFLFKLISVQRKACPIAWGSSTVDLDIGLVVFVLNSLNRQVLFLGEIQITEGL